MSGDLFCDYSCGLIVFETRFTKGALSDLAQLSAFKRVRILDAIEAQLSTQPLTRTRKRKPLGPGDIPPWEHEPPVWELRVGQFRVFYDVDPEAQRVYVRAVRLKGRRRTKEIL